MICSLNGRVSVGEECVTEKKPNSILLLASPPPRKLDIDDADRKERPMIHGCSISVSVVIYSATASIGTYIVYPYSRGFP